MGKGPASSALAATPTAHKAIAKSSVSAHSSSSTTNTGRVSSALHFSEFAMVGIKGSVLRGKEPPQRFIQPVEALEVIMMDSPRTSGGEHGRGSPSSPVPPPSSSAALEKITEFCFPSGGRLELAPAAHAELYTGKHRDSTHILQFMDEFGTTSYGVCITIWEPHPECPAAVVEALRRLLREDAAARAIQLFWREALARPPMPARLRSASTSSATATEDSLDTSEVGWVRRGLLNRMMRRRLQGQGQGQGGDAGGSGSGSGSGWGTPRSKGGLSPSWGHAAGSFSSPRTPPAPHRLARADSSALEEYQRHVRAADGHHGPSPRYGGRGGSARLLSLREAADWEGDEMVVVAPRCFCLMSAQPNHPALMKLLQIIVDREREQAEGGTRLLMGNKALSALKRRHSCNALSSSPPTTSDFLAGAAARSVTGAGALSGGAAGCDVSVLRRRFLDHVQHELGGNSGGSLTISYPAYSTAPSRVDLPLVALDDWTCAVLFSRVSADVIVKLINLLLLEQSLVIVGEDLGLVSAIGTGLISLLAPFRWDNPFVPSLPAALADVLQSPVPYIVGIAADPEFDPTHATPHAAVLHLGRCREHLRLPDVKLPLPHAYQLLQEVHDSARVFVGRRSRCWANLHLATYMSGLTVEETTALANVKGVFRCYVENLCGDIKYRQAWRKYGFLNGETGDFAFEPAWFLAPLEVMLHFQSALVRTQMLAAYIERRRHEDRQEEERLARCRRFLALWLAFRVRLKRKRLTP